MHTGAVAGRADWRKGDVHVSTFYAFVIGVDELTEQRTQVLGRRLLGDRSADEQDGSGCDCEHSASSRHAPIFRRCHGHCKGMGHDCSLN
jgi:hypothetical protein